MEILTSIYVQNAGLLAVRLHRSVATACFPCRLPRFPTSRLDFGKGVASRVTQSHVLKFTDVFRIRVVPRLMVAAPFQP